ncbi:hypothetical protein AMTRI_Chr08g165850 [Amborella trichopoda]
MLMTKVKMLMRRQLEGKLQRAPFLSMMVVANLCISIQRALLPNCMLLNLVVLSISYLNLGCHMRFTPKSSR